VRLAPGGLRGTPIVRLAPGGLRGTPIVRLAPGGLRGTPIVRLVPCVGVQIGFKEPSALPESIFSIAWKFRTPFGVGSSGRINFPVSRPRSGIPLAVASERALATITTDKRSVFIKRANTVIPSEPHGKNTTFAFIVFIVATECYWRCS